MIPAGPRYIVTRSIFLIALLAAGLSAWSYFKKNQRRDDLVRQLRTITTDPSFFRQFDAEEARKSLVRGVGLIAEATLLGLPADEVVNRAMGTEKDWLDAGDTTTEDLPLRERLIRDCLRVNYENFIKIGYSADAGTLDEARQGRLPPIPIGPHAGAKAEIQTLIRPDLSPGIDRVLPNLEIRPPTAKTDGRPSDIETAAARKLARDLADAAVIEEAARDRILQGLGGAQ